MSTPVENPPTNATDEIARDPDARTYRSRFDPSEPNGATVAVTNVVATALGRRVENVGPLEDHLDACALDRLFQSRDREDVEGELTVSFTVDGVDVTVRDDGVVLGRRHAGPSV